MKINWFKINIKDILLKTKNIGLHGEPNELSEFFNYLKIGVECRDCSKTYWDCTCNLCEHCKFLYCLCEFNLNHSYYNDYLLKEISKVQTIILDWINYNLSKSRKKQLGIFGV